MNGEPLCIKDSEPGPNQAVGSHMQAQSVPNPGLPGKGDPQCQALSFPEEADLLVAMATVKDYVSF